MAARLQDHYDVLFIGDDGEVTPHLMLSFLFYKPLIAKSF